MAIKDKSKKPYISDRDTNIFIGLDMPLRKTLAGVNFDCFVIQSWYIFHCFSGLSQNSIENWLDKRPGCMLRY